MERENDLFRVVRDAEQMRVAGKYKVAALFAREVSDVIPREFLKLDDDSKLAIQQLHRIWVSSLLVMANKELSGNDAMEILDKAQRVVERFYEPDEFVDAAKQTTHDQHGNEYLMFAEQQRDVAWLGFSSFEITGNSAFFEKSISALNQALAYSDAGSSAHLLATMERYHIEQQMPTESKGSMRPSLPWDAYEGAYTQLVEVCNQSGNMDRKAAVSAYFLEQALKKKKLSGIDAAMQNLYAAAKETGVPAWKYTSKFITKKLVRAIQKRTYKKGK